MPVRYGHLQIHDHAAAGSGKTAAQQAVEAALPAKLTGHPVQVVYSRREEFFFRQLPARRGDQDSRGSAGGQESCCGTAASSAPANAQPTRSTTSRKIKLVEPRYEDLETSVILTAGKTSELRQSMKPLPAPKVPFGMIRTEYPAGASKFAAVYVNDHYMGHAGEFNNSVHGSNCRRASTMSGASRKAALPSGST